MAVYVLEHKLHSLNRLNKHSFQLTPNGLALAFYSTLTQLLFLWFDKNYCVQLF